MFKTLRLVISTQRILHRTFTMSAPRHAAKVSSQQFQQTSGGTDPVWVHTDPYANRPKFATLSKNVEADVCVIGSGISGISTAYELIKRGKSVCMIEARDILSGESGRTSGHLANALDDHYTEISKKHGKAGAKAAADSHTWALNRVGEISKELGISCEYRHLPGYEFSQYPRGDPKHDEEIEDIKQEVEVAKSLGLDVQFRDDLQVKGWDGKPDQRGGAVFQGQATFHPTQYLVGLLKWLKGQPKFQCYANTRAMSIAEKGEGMLGFGPKHVVIKTESGHQIDCDKAVEATCVPLQKLSIIVEMEYKRTYAIAIRVPKGSVEDCLFYDSAEEYKYVRMTRCDDKDDYMVVGGCDHKVGLEDTHGRFEELETWTRERFTRAGTVDYAWSGQIFEPVDYMGFIGKNQGNEHIYIITGDSGNGLTHGVLASKLIADEIDGVKNPWVELYSPKRLASIIKSAKSMLTHDVEINLQYKRFLKSDIKDIEDLAPGTGGVLNPTTSGPVAVYKAPDGKITKMSAICPHLHGVVCWNDTEKSFDCPVHASRFSADGVCVMGPAKANLKNVE